MNGWYRLVVYRLIPVACLVCSHAGLPDAQAGGPQAAHKNSLGMEFVRIPAGEYRRGFDEANGRRRQFDLAHPYSNKQNLDLESPAHIAIISRPFDLQTTEVTVAQFRQFVEATGYQTDAENHGGALVFVPEARDYVDRFQKSASATWRAPGFEQTDEHPVVAVSWNDAMQFCEWLSKREQGTYRLPSEAEWEYACRAAGQTWYSWGTDPNEAYAYANVADGALEAAYPNTTRYQRAVGLAANEGDGSVFTARTASYRANAWGLHDMHGNVWEWCRDRWSADLYQRVLDDVPRAERAEWKIRDPLALEATEQHAYGDWRCLRGGAWTCAPAAVRCSIRTYAEAADSACYTGFRVVRE